MKESFITQGFIQKNQLQSLTEMKETTMFHKYHNERKSDAKMISFIGILSAPGALFASKDFVTEFTLSGVTLSVAKDDISIWVLFNALFLILTMLA